MKEQIVFAGFGGQGILLSGKLVCLAAMEEGRFVSHIPSYGAEMRGGTANCSVVVADEAIASPVVRHPSICVVLNRPSLEKFEESIQPEGLLIFNTSLIDLKPQRADLDVLGIDASRLAAEIGSERSANMIAIGALVRKRPGVASLDSIERALGEAVSSRNLSLNEINRRALRKGYELAG
jgi:2-oxoglutarate ferredoxin oxidoreductase subunit gamma